MLSKLDGDEKEQFVISFHLYLAYGSDTTKYVIDLDTIWEWIGLSRKDAAKRILITNFVIGRDYMVEKPLHIDVERPQNGGQNKEKILLNVETFKAFCMLCTTEKARKTRLYYIKMETIYMEYIKQRSQALIEALQKEISLNELVTQKKLIQSNTNTPLVYLMRVEKQSDGDIIKIGETDDIATRMQTHKQDFPSCALLDVFPVQRPHALEQYVIHRKEFVEHAYKSTEIFKLDDMFTYDHIVKVIKKNLNNFDKMSSKERRQNQIYAQRMEVLKILAQATNERERQVLTDLLEKLNKDSLDEDMDTEEPMMNNVPCTSKTVYQYDPTDLKTPIKSHNSLANAARSINTDKVNASHVRLASNNNTLLGGYRWLYTDEPRDQLPELPPTEQEKKKQRNTGPVAQLLSLIHI